MTEQEWLQGENLELMVDFARSKISTRKLRLFCCACAWQVCTGRLQVARHFVTVAERFSDGLAGPEEIAGIGLVWILLPSIPWLGQRADDAPDGCFHVLRRR